jgi:hypothetical protein
MIDDGALVYYPLDEVGGTVVHDHSGHAVSAAIKGDVTLGAKGAFSAADRAMQFDGSLGWVETAVRQTKVAAFTVEVWFRTSESPTGFGWAFAQSRGAGSGRSLTLGLAGDQLAPAGRPFFALDSDGVLIGVATALAFNDGRWHQLVGTWSSKSGTPIDPGQFDLYVDGTASSVTPIALGGPATAPLSGSGGIKIARHDLWDANFKGRLERVAIFSRALAPQRILHHYNLYLVN